jgi:hypothetical protein
VDLTAADAHRRLCQALGLDPDTPAGTTGAGGTLQAPIDDAGGVRPPFEALALRDRRRGPSTGRLLLVEAVGDEHLTVLWQLWPPASARPPKASMWADSVTGVAPSGVLSGAWHVDTQEVQVFTGRGGTDARAAARLAGQVAEALARQDTRWWSRQHGIQRCTQLGETLANARTCLAQNQRCVAYAAEQARGERPPGSVSWALHDRTSGPLSRRSARYTRRHLSCAAPVSCRPLREVHPRTP